jgi:chromosome segregation ATPase
MQTLISRVLPLTKVIPKPKVEPKPSPPPKKAPVKIKRPDNYICDRPECIFNRQKLATVKAENDPLKQELSTIERKVIAARNKKALIEKSILMAQQKNESLRTAMAATMNRVNEVEANLHEWTEESRKIKQKMDALQAEVDAMNSKIEHDRQVIQGLNDSKLAPKMRIVREPATKEARRDREETATLRPIGNNEDSDDD